MNHFNPTDNWATQLPNYLTSDDKKRLQQMLSQFKTGAEIDYTHFYPLSSTIDKLIAAKEMKAEINELRKEIQKLNGEFHDKILDLVKSYNSGLSVNNLVIKESNDLMYEIKTMLEKE